MELLFLLIIIILWVSYKEKADELTDIKFPSIRKFREEMEELREKRREARKVKAVKEEDVHHSTQIVEEDKYVVEANKNLEKLKEHLKQNPPKVTEEVVTHTKEVTYYLDGKPHKWENGKFTPIED